MAAKSRFPIMVVILWSVFYGLILLIMFEGVRQGVYGVIGMLIPAFMLLYHYVKNVDFDIPGLARNKNFIALDGTISTAETGLEPIHGGRVRISIATKKEYVPKDDWYRLDGVKGFMASLAGQVHLDIIRPAWQIKEISGETLGAKEGAYLLLGGLDESRPINLIDLELKAKIDYYESVLRKLNTIFETAKAQSSTDSKERAGDVVGNFMKLGPVLREWQKKDTRPTPMVINPGGSE